MSALKNFEFVITKPFGEPIHVDGFDDLIVFADNEPHQNIMSINKVCQVLHVEIQMSENNP